MTLVIIKKMYAFISLIFMLSTGLIAWDGDTLHDFGDIQMQKDYTHEFRFINIGDEPVTIESIRPSCGCTVPKWDEKPILPDSSSVIKVNFRPRHAGYTRKLIKVYFSGQRKAEKLYIEAFVEK